MKTQVDIMANARKARSHKKLIHSVRAADGSDRLVEIENYTRSKAIMAHCTECMGFEENPEKCTSTHCALYPFRKKILLAYKKEGKK